MVIAGLRVRTGNVSIGVNGAVASVYRYEKDVLEALITFNLAHVF